MLSCNVKQQQASRQKTGWAFAKRPAGQPGRIPGRQSLMWPPARYRSIIVPFETQAIDYLFSAMELPCSRSRSAKNHGLAVLKSQTQHAEKECFRSEPAALAPGVISSRGGCRLP
jgi:hypothetical protein